MQQQARGETSASEAFRRVRSELLTDVYRRQPTLATYLGIHDYDDRLEDYSAEAAADEVASARAFQRRLESIGPGELTSDDAIDRQQLLLAVEAIAIKGEVSRQWATSPDVYSSGLTNTAYAMVKRDFAPAEERLARLVARLRAMPEALDHARRNIDSAAAVFTELAIEQIDGNREFFEHAVPEAFATVERRSLQREFQQANRAVVTALASYKVWLETDLLPRSRGEFACGAETYQRRLWAEEMIDTPIEALLAMAEADLARNQEAFVDTARQIDPRRTTAEVLADVERHRPVVEDLLSTTQGELDALAAFLREHGIVTLPSGSAIEVKETPPFLRATTSASIEVPGPFEQVATASYYNLTLPDPRWTEAAREDFMRQWYYAAITNVSAHEVWPGHHLQFLHARSIESEVRKVFGVASNVEGWAHYAEQMIVDEGFHGDDPRYRLAQLHDALLRDARFVVGIRLHTQGMSIPEAEQFFLTEARQTPHVSRIEARRGTFDATYGCYTLGKLLVLRLRDEYKAALGSGYSLRRFHDAFMRVGPLPLPLVRRVLIEEASRG